VLQPHLPILNRQRIINTATVSIDSDLAAAAKQRGQLFNRSMAEQIERWAQIGRVIEESPDFSVRQIAQVLCAFDQSNFPEHPHHRVASMEAAVEVVGMRIAELSAQLDSEENSENPDDGRIEEFLNKISELRELQEDLTPEDTVRVQAILDGNIPVNE